MTGKDLDKETQEAFNDTENVEGSSKKTTQNKGKNVFVLIIGLAVIVTMMIFVLSGSGTPAKKADQRVTSSPSIDRDAVSPPLSQGNANDNARLNALAQENAQTKQDLAIIKQDLEAQIAEAKALRMSSSNSGGGGSAASPMSRASRESERFTPEYQQKVQHFKSNTSNQWAIADDQFKALRNTDISGTVSPEMRNLEGVPSGAINPFSLTIPSGTRIIATTNQPINSDHPGYFTSRILRPQALKGAELICQLGAQSNDRIPVQPVKCVLNGREIAIAGQVEMGFPGLEGAVTNHWPERIIPGVASAAIGGAAIAYGMMGGDEGRIDTRDQLVSQVVGQSVTGIQNEVTRLGGDKPNTVEVPTGTQFSILLTDKLILSGN